MAEGIALWFSAPGFELLDVVDDGVELVVEVQTTTAVVGCSECGVRVRPKDALLPRGLPDERRGGDEQGRAAGGVP